MPCSMLTPLHGHVVKFLLVSLLCFVSVYVLLVLQSDQDAVVQKVQLPKVDLVREAGPRILETLHINGSTLRRNERPIELGMIFARANENRALKYKLEDCLASLLRHTDTPLRIHLITDGPSVPTAKQVLDEVSHLARVVVQIDIHDVESIVESLQEVVSYMQQLFSPKPGAYYGDMLFLISIGIHRIFTQDKLIMVDVDTKFYADIQDLHDHFQNFSSEAVIGLAWEQQPVYRHLLHTYRSIHPDTHAGSPPPDGQPGFNSGILLLNLKRMRDSVLYNAVVNATVVKNYAEKYKFRGHLGDQDFYSLISFEHKDLFYVLPCTWNRQLCQWWKFQGYHDVFDNYHRCDGEVNVYHGNCNAIFPD